MKSLWFVLCGVFLIFSYTPPAGASDKIAPLTIETENYRIQTYDWGQFSISVKGLVINGMVGLGVHWRIAQYAEDTVKGIKGSKENIPGGEKITITGQMDGTDFVEVIEARAEEIRVKYDLALKEDSSLSESENLELWPWFTMDTLREMPQSEYTLLGPAGVSQGKLAEYIPEVKNIKSFEISDVRGIRLTYEFPTGGYFVDRRNEKKPEGLWFFLPAQPIQGGTTVRKKGDAGRIEFVLKLSPNKGDSPEVKKNN